MKILNTSWFLFLCSLFLLTSCSRDAVEFYAPLDEEGITLKEQINNVSSIAELKMASSHSFDSIPQDPKNPITEAKVNLGKFLFHETGLALNPKNSAGANTYSCASCHQAKAGFQSGIKQGIGEGGAGFGLFGEARIMQENYEEDVIDVQPIRSPTILNSAYQKLMLWNGQFGATDDNIGTEAQWTEDTPKAANKLGFEGVETQALAGIDVHRLKCDPEMIQSNAIYRSLFDSAFPEIEVPERYTKLYAALAIAAYERSVIASEAPFQKWLHGEEDAMTSTEKKGAQLFFGKAKCYECHSGPGLNGMDFHALGMKDLSGSNVHGIVDEDTKKGRGGFTKNPEDNYKFKTPTLYNLKDVKFLGHGGSFTSVKEVILYKNRAMAENYSIPEEKLSDKFTPLELSIEELNQLTTFVENSLYDANLARYVPESIPSGLCFPNADTASKEDMGCN